jgi:hypothetical protein
LTREGIGICDIVACCSRQRLTASDLDMEELELRDLFSVLESHINLATIIFVGGRSKNGPDALSPATGCQRSAA